MNRNQKSKIIVDHVRRRTGVGPGIDRLTPGYETVIVLEPCQVSPDMDLQNGFDLRTGRFAARDRLQDGKNRCRILCRTPQSEGSFPH